MEGAEAAQININAQSERENNLNISRYNGKKKTQHDVNNLHFFSFDPDVYINTD